MWIADIFRKVGTAIADVPRLPFYSIHRRYCEFTMVPVDSYVRNLSLARQFRHVAGAVVECGVWKGGMSAGMAEVVGPERRYYLFDSFLGCPQAQEIDGLKAKLWQQQSDSPQYYNNSSADIGFCQDAMRRAGADRCSIIKGWFEYTLPAFRAEGGIAILRLDADWYESTTTCLEYLFPQLNDGGVLIVDDYYAFEGCSRALHDYLSKNRLSQRIRQLDNDVCYLVNAMDR